MTTIYDQHEATFRNVSAYVILDANNQRVATIAFKYASAVTCYLHIIGLEMTRGRAGGGGYDRKSASAYDAVMKTMLKDDTENHQYYALVDKIKTALTAGNGASHWDAALHQAGFTVLQAV